MVKSSIRMLVVGIALLVVAAVSGCASHPVLDFPHLGAPTTFEPDVERM